MSAASFSFDPSVRLHGAGAGWCPNPKVWECDCPGCGREKAKHFAACSNAQECSFCNGVECRALHRVYDEPIRAHVHCGADRAFEIEGEIASFPSGNAFGWIHAPKLYEAVGPVCDQIRRLNRPPYRVAGGLTTIDLRDDAILARALVLWSVSAKTAPAKHLKKLRDLRVVELCDDASILHALDRQVPLKPDFKHHWLPRLRHGSWGTLSGLGGVARGREQLIADAKAAAARAGARADAAPESSTAVAAKSDVAENDVRARWNDNPGAFDDPCDEGQDGSTDPKKLCGRCILGASPRTGRDPVI